MRLPTQQTYSKTSGRVHAGDRVTLACSCKAEVLVPIVLMLPRHHVVRIVAHAAVCRGLHHVKGRRVVVRSRRTDGTRAFSDLRDPRG